ncbi:hypothetical protein [Kitasatospora sp. NPDC001175]|uniref:Uncharacterized protein n=1 Tax=Kitasatospora cystarginea TaxID=58350 RepID=A0ABP5RT06_9ACTN
MLAAYDGNQAGQLASTAGDQTSLERRELGDAAKLIDFALGHLLGSEQSIVVLGAGPGRPVGVVGEGGGCLAADRDVFARSCGPVSGSAQEAVEGSGEVGFVPVAFPAPGDGVLEVLPQLVAEGLVDVVGVDPRDRREAAVAGADPDPAGVVGVGWGGGRCWVVNDI